MENKQITIDGLLSGNLSEGVMYTIIGSPKRPLKYKIEDFLEKHKLDSYSRSRRRDYRNGVTNDLSYDDTMSKCSDNQFIKMIWVDGYSAFMEFKNNEIDKNVEHKVKRLLADNKVGYIIDDSYGCSLCCRAEDYKMLCDYLSAEYDKNDDNKEYHYNSLFDDILGMFRDYCDVIIDSRKNWSERESYKIDKRTHEITRYIIVNLEEYVDYFMNAREIDKGDEADYWVNKLWIKANEDYNNKR